MHKPVFDTLLKLKQTNNKTEYTGPQPPAFSGPHRYMVFAYEQLINLDGAPVPAYRARFALAEWFEALGGERVARGPVASTGFISEF